MGNRLLASLSGADDPALLARLDTLTLAPGEVLHEPGATIRDVYFPVDCVVSLLAATEAREVIEVGLVGHEGMVGIPLVLGVEVSSVRAMVLAGGSALRMNAARFQDALRHCAALQRELQRYTGEKLAEARQAVACNRFHPVAARLARTLLLTSERVRSARFFLTQAFLAEMFGVRRATLCAAAASFQRRGVIRYCRGHVQIVDRAGLAAAACACYQAPQNSGA